VVSGTPASVVRSWFEAVQRPEVATAIEAVQLEIAEAIREVGPICLASGNCCKFEAHGHRLYASGLEVARCVAICDREGRGITMEDVEEAVERGNCPWQDGRLCTARAGRPIGCRVYFCDPRAREIVPQLAERAHQRIKSIHDEHGIEYVYGEWRTMLRDVLGAEPGRVASG
jgi:Fe-S-cluster containining protein